MLSSLVLHHLTREQKQRTLEEILSVLVLGRRATIFGSLWYYRAARPAAERGSRPEAG